MQFMPSRKARIVQHMNQDGMTYKQAVAAVDDLDRRCKLTSSIMRDKVAALVASGKLKEERPGIIRMGNIMDDNDPYLNALAESMEEADKLADQS